jgi:uncharacterized integral membrane protein
MSEIILGIIIYILMYILVYILLEFNTTDVKLKHKIALFVTWPLLVMLFILFVIYVGIKKIIIYVKRRF